MRRERSWLKEEEEEEEEEEEKDKRIRKPRRIMRLCMIINIRGTEETHRGFFCSLIGCTRHGLWD